MVKTADRLPSRIPYHISTSQADSFHSTIFPLKVSKSRDKIVEPQLLPKSKQNALRIDGGDALKNER